MRNLIHTSEITEGKAATAIFNACRGNEARERTATVTFNQFGTGIEGLRAAKTECDRLDCELNPARPICAGLFKTGARVALARC
jgi:hypothetical protein